MIATGPVFLKLDHYRCSKNHLQLVQMLSSQAAISIETAQLYNNLEIKVAQRTEELSTALENLKTMQKQLVDAEKKAALGELVAGIPMKSIHRLA